MAMETVWNGMFTVLVLAAVLLVKHWARAAFRRRLAGPGAPRAGRCP